MTERYVLLFRHAQTCLSSGKRLIGQYDEVLSSTGIKESHRIGELIKNCHIDHVFSSTLARAKQSAAIISSYIGQEPQTDEDMSEISLGEWDGRFIEDIRKSFPVEYQERGSDMIRFRPPGGENFIDLQKRVVKSFRKIMGSDGNLILVAHASVNRIILREILNFPIGHIFLIHQDYSCCNMLIKKSLETSVKLINADAKCAVNKIKEWEKER